jgi:hypothetical protein
MRLALRKATVLLALCAALVAHSGGCGTADRSAKKDGDKPAPVTSARDKEGKGEHKHDEWWCAEHGIPEEECSMCSAKVEKSCKAKGDWCEKHNRALSQCFICNPRRKEFYAAKYRARYGKEPPPIEDEGGKKGEKK